MGNFNLKSDISISYCDSGDKTFILVKIGKNNLKFKENFKEKVGLKEGYYYVKKVSKIGLESDYYIELVSLFEQSNIISVRLSDLIKEFLGLFYFDLEIEIEN
ncbi:MAG: hypothetical protein KatS3mg068_1512 [Candidatus Sericytochromatia bacterium]|nr:MAG: hypothetical protein KatS3mg068_1512 [Candidatus Sericytochromatia bacterium]